MITVLVFALIGFVLIFFLEKERNCFDVEMGFAIGAIVGIVIAKLVGIPVGIFSPYVDEKTQEIPLIAFHDGQSVHGSFVFGCGSVDGEGVYLYYTKREDGGIVQGRKPADSSVIYERDRKDAVLETWIRETKTSTSKDGWWKYFAFPSDTFTSSYFYKFFVPKGTVVRKFVADLN